MLDRTDFVSWQQRIRLYCRGKENGVNILKSIDEGPFLMGTTRDTLAEGTEGAHQLGPEQAQVYSDLSLEDKDRYNADIRATNILLQGLPKDINTLIIIYKRCKRHMGKCEEAPRKRKTMCQNAAEFKFVVISGCPEWGKIRNNMKLNRGFEGFPTIETAGLSPTDNLIENLTNTLALPTQSYNTYLPQINNQLRTSSNTRNQSTVQDGKANSKGTTLTPSGHRELQILQRQDVADARSDNGCSFEQTKECYLTEVIPFFKTLKEHFEGIQKALTKEMKDIFEELEAEVDQKVVNRKHDEIERKNLLIANDNLIADCLSKEVFYIATKFVSVTVS
ncbi:hypothetical protein Tco_1094335 [Tanacetum coccineum]|uniref:Integrase, catalytic region, zinc finger, CCHC-type, peptidase aspartic, catalytic n=1 Tax=Tanacetum coccineum TaxID=301880 RepID=A0ABQ5IHC5_9ASTR